MRKAINRRRFLGAAVAPAVFQVVPRHVLGQGYVAPNDKITLAYIGLGTQGLRELGGLLNAPEVQIVSVCDPNTDSTDYVDWSRDGLRSEIGRLLGRPDWRAGSGGIPGGREVGREVIQAYYAAQRGDGSFKGVSSYADFRELLAKEPDVDAVKIMTPDHLHATIAIAAMNRGKHVMMHKPLANRLRESRLVLETARRTGVATYLLAWSGNGSMDTIMAWIRDGAIGTLREVHNWSNRPVWPQYATLPQETPPVPEGFDWDLWLGPALERPYHPHYTHAVFRGWYDFGGGAIADMGHYSLWAVFKALELDAPVRI
ncbi:MAG TPA: Gfo/Idh/MocA family oxidoreductase, partial [Candidatus Hydrogenedentes bacterium]|nr:Gfo/Idh/MocA family oxidoreductase [Candidatus Hydrogenedentota bacterium]